MKNVSVSSTILVVLSILGYSSNTSVAKDINKIDVKDCSIDYDEVDFCSKERLKDYNNIIKNKAPNFDKNKFLMNFKEKNYLYFAVIDLKKLKVFKFPASLSVMSNIKPIEFSSDSNLFCLNGDFNQYRNSYSAVKICYTYNNGNFDFKSRVELDKDINKYNNSNNVIKKLKLPISSDFFSKCREKNSAKKCTQLENSNNRAYSFSELRKIYPDFINIFNDTKIKTLNVNTFRFLPQLTDSFYSIAEKYIDTDESSSSEFYLIKIKPDLKVEKIGDYYSIDSSGVITYKDENGKVLKKNLR
ncbi:hypothetical protein [Acinetobacter nosocomialis]|uniref:hypothetical protein n=1 Tax=Acinetobacter nosocomialis TaxID=106654 RepID=UPI000DE75080|nr:hypothetical protein [Acinetobacter nosocomialis]SSV30648.1 Uncharacterised protein [Acinetobacter nosocomialis]